MRYRCAFVLLAPLWVALLATGCIRHGEPDPSPHSDYEQNVREMAAAKSRVRYQFIAQPISGEEFEAMSKAMLQSVAKKQDIKLIIQGETCELPYALFGGNLKFFHRPEARRGHTYVLMSEQGGGAWNWATDDFGYIQDAQEFRQVVEALLRARVNASDAEFRINRKTYVMPKEAVVTDSIYFHCDTAPDPNAWRTYLAFQFGDGADIRAWAYQKRAIDKAAAPK